MQQIVVESVSKLYRISGARQPSQDFSVSAARALLAPIRNLRQLRQLDRFDDDGADTVLWALRDVSFEVQPGEVVGIIGRNGAGKSTLLKLLSRITRPTRGRIMLRGRISSLLEVGTGFHPELSGRENIFLNGAIIGMRAAEVRAKLDEIVEFSGVERFLDTPIKRYSSGMKVRLAFAVAAHLEPDILVIDEVLAVGDTEFQKKCLGTMAKFGSSGRTVMFVSHNLAAVQSLCGRGVVLERGQIRFDGEVDLALRKYLDALAPGSGIAGFATPVENRGFLLERLSIGAGSGNGDLLRSGCASDLRLSIRGSVDLPSVILNVWISGGFGERLLVHSSRVAGIALVGFQRRLACRIQVPRLMIMPGHYQLNAALYSSAGEELACWEQQAEFEVHPDPVAPAVTLPAAATRGIVYAPAEWTVETDTN